MSADKAQLLGLIGLRALAVRDPFEYRRVADLPITELDRNIHDLLKTVSDQECDTLYQQLIGIGGQPDADMLLDQVSFSSFRRAVLEAMESESGKQPSEDSELDLPASKPDSELSNPGAIVAYELDRANLKWASRDSKELMPFRFDNEFMVLEYNKVGGTFLEALGNVADILSKSEQLIGSRSSKKSAIWKICERILLTKGTALKKKATQSGLFSAARSGRAGEWLSNHLKPDARRSESP